MAGTTTVFARNKNSIQFNVAEDGTAADLQTIDVNALLAAATPGDPVQNQVINEVLNPSGGFADQAAAQAALFNNFDVLAYFTALGGANGPASFVVDANVSAPAVDGNFRLELTMVKAADTDVNNARVRLSLRHSLTA